MGWNIARLVLNAAFVVGLVVYLRAMLRRRATHVASGDAPDVPIWLGFTVAGVGTLAAAVIGVTVGLVAGLAVLVVVMAMTAIGMRVAIRRRR